MRVAVRVRVGATKRVAEERTVLRREGHLVRARLGQDQGEIRLGLGLELGLGYGFRVRVGVRVRL